MTTSPCLMVLVGLPGSGKSTIAQELEGKGWARVNQDELGSAEECKKALLKALKSNSHVVLDRCNPRKKDRRMFISEMRRALPETPFIPEVLHVDPGIEVCKERAAARRKHPTLNSEDSARVIDEFSGTMEPPEEHEGWKAMHRVSNGEELKKFLLYIKESYPPPEKKGAVSGKGQRNNKKK